MMTYTLCVCSKWTLYIVTHTYPFTFIDDLRQYFNNIASMGNKFESFTRINPSDRPLWVCEYKCENGTRQQKCENSVMSFVHLLTFPRCAQCSYENTKYNLNKHTRAQIKTMRKGAITATKKKFITICPPLKEIETLVRNSIVRQPV